MPRAVVDLDARATVLEASERLSDTVADGDLALVVAAGAPVLRSAVFLEVLRAQVGPRRLSLVTNDARARSLASSVHVPAYASVAALERLELDRTERLTPARRAAIAAARPSARPEMPSARRLLGVAGSLAAALLILGAVVIPEAKVVVAPAVEPLGPVEMTIRAGGGGEITPKILTAQISAKVAGTASGERIQERRATGSVRLQNKSTEDQAIPRGTIFATPEGLQFLSTEDARLPRSVIIPPFELFIGRVDVRVEAAVAGEEGNVPAGRITVSPRPDKYEMTNPAPASGGQITRVPVVRLEDYDAAVRAAPDALRKEAEAQLARWVAEPRSGEQVVQQVLVRRTAVGPANVDVVGRESATFDLTVDGIATAYAIPDREPARTAIDKLRASVSIGNELDERAVVTDVKSVRVDEDGVTWELTARGVQMPRIDRERIGRILAGRVVRDARPVLDAERLVLVRMERAPAWWPLLPVLGARITVQVEAPPVTQAR